MQGRIIDLALEVPELSPRELAVRFTDQESYFVSEASVYRRLKSRDLIPSPAFIQIKAAEEFHTKTTAPNQLWQTDFTYFKVIGWGWLYLCTARDDFSPYVIAWQLCTGITVGDTGFFTQHPKTFRCLRPNGAVGFVVPFTIRLWGMFGEVGLIVFDGPGS